MFMYTNVTFHTTRRDESGAKLSCPLAALRFEMSGRVSEGLHVAGLGGESEFADYIRGVRVEAEETQWLNSWQESSNI